MACIEPAELPAFMQALDGYKAASNIAMTAFKLLMLTATRTSEVRYAKWADIDLETACWTIPAEQQGRKGKNGKRSEHKVPLSTQAVAVLKDLPRTSEYVFPNRDDNTKVISENTILGIIDAIGYKGKMTGHGFRSLARSILGDMGHRWEVLEAMLSHSLGNSTERAYVRTTYYAERIGLMQTWSDLLYSYN
jgi:integrase